MLTTQALTILRNKPANSPSGAPDQFWEVLEGYRSTLIAHAASILGNAHDAEDVVQETFCEAASGRSDLPMSGSVLAWLRAINRCNALNRLRGKRRNSEMMSRQANQSDGSSTTGGFSRLELRESLDQAIATLPDDLRTLVKLRFFEHRSYKEIAKSMNIPIGNIGGLLLDASVRLSVACNSSSHSADRKKDGRQP
jgi:RNA polymerase sigma-70 factor (ECF subfamily)